MPASHILCSGHSNGGRPLCPACAPQPLPGLRGRGKALCRLTLEDPHSGPSGPQASLCPSLGGTKPHQLTMNAVYCGLAGHSRSDAVALFDGGCENVCCSRVEEYLRKSSPASSLPAHTTHLLETGDQRCRLRPRMPALHHACRPLSAPRLLRASRHGRGQFRSPRRDSDSRLAKDDVSPPSDLICLHAISPLLPVGRI